MEEIIRTIKAADNESTSAPYWLILDPSQNMRCDIGKLAHQITGPFFCREDAERHLIARRYAYSGRAKVWCASGHHSAKYERFCRLHRTEVK